MGNVIVTVVDDTVVQIGTIVLAVCRCREVCQCLQVLVSNAGHHIHQVASHLTLQIVLVGHILQSLENTHGIIHGVDLLPHTWVNDQTVTVGIEHVRATIKCAHPQNGY